jgi:hypothetical protein
MRGPGKYILVLGIAAYCAEAGVVGGASSAEQYEKIPQRNLFGLREPVQPTIESPKPQLPKITLSGITTMGSKLVFLKVQFPPKPGEQQGEQSFMLTAGQREGGIEILEINENAKTIRVNNFGTEMTIGFDKDAAKVAGAPPPGPGPAGAPPNIANRIRAANPASSGFQRMVPTRTGRQVPAMAEPPPAAPGQVPAQTIIQQQTAPSGKPMTAEEQAVLRELEQAAQGTPTQPQ